MKVQDVLLKAMAKKITWWEAAEIIGVSERTMRRWRERMEEEQLVGIARAIIANPKVILADEPTGNLHSSQAREIMERFKQLNNEGTTIIQVTHSEANAAFGNRVIHIVDGWIS